jgi:DNA modification methylase
VWDKDNGSNGYADCELAWTNFDKAVRRKKYRWMGMIQERMGHDKEERVHPTQKPIEIMEWVILQAPKADTILDPFMGSGTTLVAAKHLHRQAIGIEIEEKYCEIAAKRLAQGVLPL